MCSLRWLFLNEKVSKQEVLKQALEESFSPLSDETFNNSFVHSKSIPYNICHKTNLVGIFRVWMSPVFPKLSAQSKATSSATNFKEDLLVSKVGHICCCYVQGCRVVNFVSWVKSIYILLHVTLQLLTCCKKNVHTVHAEVFLVFTWP